VTPLENIPTLNERPGVAQAMEMVVAAIEAMEPDGQLTERWEEYKSTMVGWAKHEQPLTPEALGGLRLSLEGMAGDSEAGELLVAAAKLGLSAVLTAAPNIFHILLPERDPMHDDIAPLIEKGINLLHKARALDHFDPVVRVDYSIQERLDRRKAEHVEEMEREKRQDWVGELISNAVRPENQN
jgi:hypothetical protein